MKSVPQAGLEQTAPSQERWEAAYTNFQTPEQEIRKFLRRLRKLGASEWPRDAHIVELFCGRGNGLHALERLGFTHLEGADLSSALLQQYHGPAKWYLCDCRELPFADQSKDVLIVQGGLHHLPALPDDVQRTFAEIRRVLRRNGRLVVVEPWSTPFLTFVNMVCENPLARRLFRKLDALATMNECEEPTFSQWLTNPDLILRLCSQYFMSVQEFFVWGKWYFVGTPRPNAPEQTPGR